MKKYELDIVTEMMSFDESVESLKNFVSGVNVVEIEMSGRGAGWPTIVIEVPNESLDKLKMWYEGADDILDCELLEGDWEVMER
jgi:hypothetical protein